MINKPILSGTRVLLRPLTAEDAGAMFDSLSDDQTRRLTGTHGTFTLEQVQAFCQRVAVADDRADYMIELLNAPGVPVGEIVLNDVDLDNQVAGFRIALYSAENFGQGIGTEATRLIVEYGFRALELNRIELEFYAFNPRAIRAYEKVGFVREGVRRDALQWDGMRIDAIMMGLLKEDFVAQ